MSKDWKFELLAPAGSYEILKAVIEAGADAVYVGGNRFGARAYANNFTEEELLDAIDYVHLRGKRLFLTVNTLLKNSEIEDLYAYLLPYYERGLDGVIVQDMGAIRYIAMHFPKMEIHASTQMTITGVEGARFLQTLGITRAVMARELSLAEMKQIHEETGIELEAFVHGALCYCYSGQCLYSSMLGGRSGNRGRCAQPCRLAYSVLDEKQKMICKDSYVLSMKDLCGVEDLEGLAEAGVYSLKIEGRMKSVEYARGVVAIYREVLDRADRKAKPSDLQALMDCGNRSGFTRAYFEGHNGPDMITMTKPSYEKHVEALPEAKPNKLPITGSFSVHEGQPMRLSLEAMGQRIQVEGEVPSLAMNRPMMREDYEKQLKKTGDTPFVFDNLSIDMEEGLFAPVKTLNLLRREGLDALTQALLSHFRRCDALPQAKRQAIGSQTLENASYFVSAEKRGQWKKAIEYSCISGIYLDSSLYKDKDLSALREDVALITSHGKKAYYILPSICRSATAKKLYAACEDLRQSGISGVLIRNYEELWFAIENLKGLELILDYKLYTFNDYALDAFCEYPITWDTVPLELNRQEIAGRDNRNSQILLYGRYPLMTSAQCVHKTVSGCDKKKTVNYLKDRYQAVFPMHNNCNECYNTIYNSLPTNLIPCLEELKRSGLSIYRLHFTTETEGETEQVLDLLTASLEGRRGSGNPDAQYTYGHYKRGVE